MIQEYLLKQIPSATTATDRISVQLTFITVERGGKVSLRPSHLNKYNCAKIDLSDCNNDAYREACYRFVHMWTALGIQLDCVSMLDFLRE